MIKTPLRYPGGKSRSVKTIGPLIPDFQEFREPFLGGGSVFLYVKQHYTNKKFWINDLYLELFKFREMAQRDTDSLIKKIYQWKTKYYSGRALHKFMNENLSLFNDLERAASFFIYNRITFSGTGLSGGYSENAFAERFTESSIQRLRTIEKVIQNVKISNLDYSDLINEPGKDVFIFLDPPYYSAKKSALYGKNGNLHKSFDHFRLAQMMKKCQHKWLITYDDSQYIRKLFSFANIIPWNLTYGMRNVTKNSNQKGEKLFISNYLENITMQETKNPALLFN